MQRKKKNSAVVYFDKGPYPLKVGVCFTLKDFFKECARYNIEPVNINEHTNAATIFLDHKEARAMLVFIDAKEAKKQTHLSVLFGLCTHEAVHVWQTVKEYIGEKNPASEQEAYYIQYIAQSLSEVLFRKLKIKNFMKGN